MKGITASDLPRAKVDWKDDGLGFNTEFHGGLNVSEKTWIKIIQTAIPSGSEWSKYYGYRSIRLYKEKVGGKATFVLSNSLVTSCVTKDGKVEKVPSTRIYLLSKKELLQLFDDGVNNFLVLIYGDNVPSWERSIDLDIEDKCLTVKSNLKRKKSEIWSLFEVALIRYVFKQGAKNFESFSTLCTEYEDVTKFSLYGLIKRDVEDRKEKKYTELFVHHDLSITWYRKKRPLLTRIKDRLLSFK